jgi:hypothetical protein
MGPSARDLAHKTGGGVLCCILSDASSVLQKVVGTPNARIYWPRNSVPFCGSQSVVTSCSPLTATDVSEESSAGLLTTCFHAVFLLGFLFDPEDEGDMSFRNVG